MDTANKDAEVVVHLSIKGKGSSQSEHLHLCVYVQEDPSASCPWPDAQVHFFLSLVIINKKIGCSEFHYHVPMQVDGHKL